MPEGVHTRVHEGCIQVFARVCAWVGVLGRCTVRGGVHMCGWVCMGVGGCALVPGACVYVWGGVHTCGRHTWVQPRADSGL